MTSLKKRTSAAVTWTMGGTFVRQGTGFIISIILARLLTPEEFGLVAMALVVITLSEVFIDVGFNSALIQSKENTSLTYSSIFYFNLFAGVATTVLTFLVAPAIGNFYGKEEVTTLVRWLSLIFTFYSLNLVQIAILRKKLNFKVVTIRTTIAAAVGGVAGIIGASIGMGVYSLVLQHIILSITGTILLWSTSDWKPDLKFSMIEVRKLANFSLYIFFDRLGSVLFKRLDVLVIGKIFPAAVLGFYTRAFSLTDIVSKYSSSNITKVFYPVLSEVQDDKQRFNEVYFKVISIVALISFGLTGILFIAGPDIILVLFGAKWEPAVPIFQVLILALSNSAFDAQMINAFKSKGKARENFQIGLLRKGLSIIPLIVAYYYGILHFTVALVFSNYLITVINIHFMKKYLDIDRLVHYKRLFESILPLLPFIAVYFIFDLEKMTPINRIVCLIAFSSLFISYNYFLKNPGLLFILKQLKGKAVIPPST